MPRATLLQSYHFICPSPVTLSAHLTTVPAQLLFSNPQPTKSQLFLPTLFDLSIPLSVSPPLLTNSPTCFSNSLLLYPCNPLQWMKTTSSMSPSLLTRMRKMPPMTSPLATLAISKPVMKLQMPCGSRIIKLSVLRLRWRRNCINDKH